MRGHVFFGQYNGNAHLLCLFIVVTWKMLGGVGGRVG